MRSTTSVALGYFYTFSQNLCMLLISCANTAEGESSILLLILGICYSVPHCLSPLYPVTFSAASWGLQSSLGSFSIIIWGFSLSIYKVQVSMFSFFLCSFSWERTVLLCVHLCLLLFTVLCLCTKEGTSAFWMGDFKAKQLLCSYH